MADISNKKSKGRILFMDDEDLIRSVLKVMLNEMGFEADFAKDGEEAIALYIKAKEDDNPYNIVILDLTVSYGMGGKEAIKRLLKIDPDVNAFVSSGYSNSPILDNFRTYGFNGVIVKPYNMKQLSDILHKALTLEG